MFKVGIWRSWSPLVITLIALTGLSILVVPTLAHQDGGSISCGQANIYCITGPNNRITVAVDKNAGASIVGLWDTQYNNGNTNLINHYDLGREVQMVQRGTFVNHLSVFQDDFSSTQELNNWSYHYGIGATIYGNLTWNSTYSRWDRSGSFPWVYSTWVHPDNTYDVILQYRAPSDGIVSFRGKFQDGDPGGGNGVRIHIYHDSTEKWWADVANGGSVQLDWGNVEFQVKRGDKILVNIDSRDDAGWDSTNLTNWGDWGTQWALWFQGLDGNWHQYSEFDFWNPTQAGNGVECGQKASYVESFTSSSSQIYAKVRPRPFNCYSSSTYTYYSPLIYEQWITFQDEVTIKLDYRIRARKNRLNWQGVNAWWEPRSEIPLVTLIGPFYNFWSYEGSSPWTNGALTKKVDNPSFGTGVSFYPTENWMAAVNGSDWGVGLIHSPHDNKKLAMDRWDARDDTDLGGGHSATENDNGFNVINATGVWSNADLPIVSSGGVEYREADFTNKVYLTLGTLTQIRSKAYALQGH